MSVRPRRFGNLPPRLDSCAATIKSATIVVDAAQLEDKWAAFALTNRLGKPLSCFNGAVRTYWPGFDLKSDPFDHPMFLPGRIAVHGAGRLADYFLRRLAAISTLRFAPRRAAERETRN